MVDRNLIIVSCVEDRKLQYFRYLLLLTELTLTLLSDFWGKIVIGSVSDSNMQLT